MQLITLLLQMLMLCNSSKFDLTERWQDLFGMWLLKIKHCLRVSVGLLPIMGGLAFVTSCNALSAYTINYHLAYSLEARSQHFSMRAAGDVNGDGISDIIIGSGFDNFGNNDGGGFLIYSGDNGDLIHNIGRFSYSTFLNDLSEFVSGVGDVNKDGFDDVAVSGNFSSLDGGGSHLGVRVYSGYEISQVTPAPVENLPRYATSDLGVLYEFQIDTFDRGYDSGLGTAAGDLNGDGYDDIAISINTGIRQSLFATSFYSGLNGEKLFEIPNRLPIDGDAVGDIDGDNNPDFIVGNYGNAKVVSSIDGSTLFNMEGFKRYSNAMSDVGDINQDGFTDLLTDSIVRSGADGSLLLDGITYFQDDPIEVIDYDSDGVNDILIRNEVFSGADSSLIFTWPEFEGTSVDALGDVNFDGIPDFLIGNENGVSREKLETFCCGIAYVGTAYVVSGADGSFIVSGTENASFDFRGRGEFDSFGLHVSSLGDLNGDGIADFAVGASASNLAYVRVYFSEVIPEPTTLSLIGLALTGLLIRRRC